MTRRAECAILNALASSSTGTHEETIVKAFDLPRDEVDHTVKRMLKDKTLVRVRTGVLFMSKLHFDRIIGKKPWPGEGKQKDVSKAPSPSPVLALGNAEAQNVGGGACEQERP